MSAPAFLNKPKHKDVVVATSRGWVVEKTGELLVSVKNLDRRIAEHLGLSAFAFEPQVTSIAVVAPDTSIDSIDSLLDGLDTTKNDIVVEDIVEAPKEEPEVVEAPPAAEKKKRGGYRPRKEKVVA